MGHLGPRMWPCAEKRRATEAVNRGEWSRDSGPLGFSRLARTAALEILFRADQTHEVNRLSSRFLRVSVPLDKELTLAEVTCLAIKNVEEIFLQRFPPRPGLG
jgi:hypothetical protein